MSLATLQIPSPQWCSSSCPAPIFSRLSVFTLYRSFQLLAHSILQTDESVWQSILRLVSRSLQMFPHGVFWRSLPWVFRSAKQSIAVTIHAPNPSSNKISHSTNLHIFSSGMCPKTRDTPGTNMDSEIIFSFWNWSVLLFPAYHPGLPLHHLNTLEVTSHIVEHAFLLCPTTRVDRWTAYTMTHQLHFHCLASSVPAFENSKILKIMPPPFTFVLTSPIPLK